jgi:hypothetical protein
MNKLVAQIILLIFSLKVYSQNRTAIKQFPLSNTTIENPAINIQNKNKSIPSNGIQHYEEDLRKERQRQRETQEIISEAKKTNINQNRNRIKYEFPVNDSSFGITCYKKAYQELVAMLNNTQKPSLKRAVFIVENAYAENNLNYNQYSTQLNELLALCEKQLKLKKLSKENTLAVNMTLHQLFSDTILIKQKSENKTHYPFAYDFEDYMGRNDWTKMFVTKLLNTRSGQCHSLPLLYCILSHELKSGATIAHSPQHTYVKFKDDKGRWCNLELTNGKITSDAWILGSGYIKSEAIKNNIYMQALTSKELIASCLFDLAQGYSIKYGFDKFSLECLNKVLEFHPNNINALMCKADYYTTLFNYVAQQYGRPTLAQLQKDPKAMQIYTKRNQLYEKLDNIGYSEMPVEAYQNWLSSVNDEKGKREHQRKTSELLNEIQGK